MAYLLTMELGEAALEVNLLPVELLCALTAGSGTAGVVVVEVRAGLTGTAGSAVGWDWWREVLLAGTGAGVGVVVEVVVGKVVVLAGVAVGVAVVVAAAAVETVLVEAASLALFSALILSISSSSLAAAEGLVGVTTGFGAAGFGAGGGVSFFLGLVSSISRS